MLRKIGNFTFLRLKRPGLPLLVFMFLTHGVFANPEIPVTSRPQITVTGIVSNGDGSLEGATVQVEGNATAVATNSRGAYTIEVPGNGMLVFSFLGYIEKKVAVNNQSTINVTLEKDPKQLEDIVVVGYRTQKRGTVTGAVSTVKSTELENVPVDNLSNALSGRLTGVTVTQAAGTPGISSSIRIRSNGTFNNNDALYVIDGVVSDKFAFDGLTPNEVESVTVLKDGASAATYGSRAANGVVLVTTKRGKTGAPKLSYNGIFGLQTPTKVPERLNAFEHASEINRKLNYVGAESNDPRYFSADELEYFKTHSWNWVDEMWKDPLTTQHALEVSGGAQNVQYFLGGSYNYASGSFDNLDFSKLSLRGNVDVSVTKDLKISLDLNTDTRNTKGPSWDVDNMRLEDLYKALMFRGAMVPPFVKGLPVGNWVEWHPGVVIQPDLAGYNRRKWTGLNTMATINYSVPFIKGLSAKASINRYARDEYTKQFNLPYNMTLFNTEGENNHIVGDEAVGIKPRAAVEFLMTREDKTERYQFNGQLNYKRSFGQHNLDALVVYEQAEEDVKWFNGRVDDLISPRIDQIVGGNPDPAKSTYDGEEEQIARISYVGLASYNYAQKYLLEASFRYDGSVIFPPGGRWGFFPSASAGWRISEEPFFKTVNFVNDLKLRASVGKVGNDQVDPFQYAQFYNIVYGAVFDGQTFGLEPGVLANPGITWEKSLNYNAGLDAALLDNKINFKLDVFYRHTYDILGSRGLSLPGTFGASLPDENYQEIDAKGFEVEAGYNGRIGTTKNQLSYYLRGNFAFSTNKIIQANQPENILPYQSEIGRPVGLQSNGSSINSDADFNDDMLFGYIATDILRTQQDLDALPEGYTILGVDPQLGMLNYKDIRGTNSDKPDGKITTDDREFLAKYSIPPMSFGFSLGAAWRSLSIDILLQGVAGAKAMLPTAGRDIQARAEESSFRYWTESWSPENPNAKYPGYRVSGYRTRFDPSTLFLVSNSFLRLKNVNVSYALPNSIVSRIRLKNVKVFFTGTNLLMVYTGNKIYDPEMNNILSYPMMKGYSFGLNVGL